MQIALEVRDVFKRFTVGAGGCHASAEVLRGVDLTVRAGEAVSIVGPPGAGKSTLLLCLAGLLTVDRGDIRWFADPSRIAAARRVIYHVTRADLMRAGRIDEQNLHLLDLPESAEHLAHLEAWIAGRVALGDAVVLSTRDAGLARRVSRRVLTFHQGILRPVVRDRARVAEGMR